MAALWTGYISEFFLYILAIGITFANAAAEIGAGGTLAFFFFRHLFSKPKDIALSKDRGITGFPALSIVVCFLVYLSILFISSLRSPYPHESWKVFLRILRFFVVYIGIVDFFYGSSKRIKRFFWVLMAVAAITLLNGIFQYIFGFDLFRHNQISVYDYLRRISGSFVHPNDFAAYIITILPLTGLLLSKGITLPKRSALMVIAVLALFCLVKTSSRSGWIGFFVAAIVFFYFYNKKFVFIAPLAIVLLICVSPHGFDRVSSLFKSEHNTVWERQELWKGTWAMVKQHPLCGMGLNTFSRFFPLFKPAEYPDLRYTHNSYLQMWSEIGLIGLLSFLALIVAMLRKVFSGLGRKIRSSSDGLLLLGLVCGFIAFLVQSAFDTNLFSVVLMIHFIAMSAYMMALNAQIELSLPAE